MNIDKLNLNLPNVACPLFFHSDRLFGSLKNYGEEYSQIYFCTLVCNFFIPKCNWSRCWPRWENRHPGQNQFQPTIKFMNSVVPMLVRHNNDNQ